MNITQELILKDLLPKFIADLQAKGRSPSTILAYRSDINQLITYLNQNQKAFASQVRPNDLGNFRDYLLSQKYTAKSTSRKLNAIKTFFRWVKDENILDNDPSKDVSHPKIESAPPKFLSPLEYRALRDVARSDGRIAAIIELILQTGIRISEVASLTMKDVKAHEITITAYASQPKRIIPLNIAAKQAIQSYVKERPNTESVYFFVSKNGKPMAVRNIRAAIDRCMQKAEIPGYSVNDLRTTFIVENLKRGVNLVTISQIAGHKRLSTTERYLELADLKQPGKRQILEEL